MAETAIIGTAGDARVRLVPADRPWTWLARGWGDLTRALPVSLAYGIGLVIVSAALTLGLARTGLVYLFLPLVGGFFIVAPLIAVGLYETSRRLERGEPVSLAIALAAWRRPKQVALMGAVLLLINLVWIRVAMLLYALFFSGVNPTLENLVQVLLFSEDSIPFLVVGTLIGAGFAAATFAVSAVSIPMLLDRDVSVMTAILTSIAVVRTNWQAMALWAALIVALTAAGIATLFLGLAVAMPLVAHATWHAYRDLVG